MHHASSRRMATSGAYGTGAPMSNPPWALCGAARPGRGALVGATRLAEYDMPPPTRR